MGCQKTPCTSFGGRSYHWQLRPPLSGLNALELYTRESVVQLVQDLSTELECDLEPMASFQGAIDAVVKAASQRVAVAPDKRPVVLSDAERRILEALRSSVLTAQDVMALLGIEKEKAEYYLHGLSAKGVIDGALPWLAEVTAWRSPYRPLARPRGSLDGLRCGRRAREEILILHAIRRKGSSWVWGCSIRPPPARRSPPVPAPLPENPPEESSR